MEKNMQKIKAGTAQAIEGLMSVIMEAVLLAFPKRENIELAEEAILAGLLLLYSMALLYISEIWK